MIKQPMSAHALRPLAAVAIAAAGLSACATAPAAPTQVARASLVTAAGQQVGTATIRATAAGLEVTVAASGLTPGKKGVHVHTTGACTPTFAAAGGHWNPGSATHGLMGAPGQHAGDMPNLDIGANGSGSLTYRLDSAATFAGLLDADGSAFVIHAGEDDQATDPSGNSGDRLACGVFAAG
jgi:Cu-Zn family superoxide dismutase